MKFKETDITFFLSKSALYIFFISDACNKLLLYLKYDFSRVSVFFRLIYEIAFFILILIFMNRLRETFVKMFLMLFLLFLIGQILFSLKVDYTYNYIENLLHFNKYFFVFIIYFSLYHLQSHRENLNKIISVLESLFLVNAAAAILGFIFQIDLFRTYIDQPYRYGYSGLIPAQNEATLFFFIGISYFYYLNFMIGNKTYKFWFFLLATVLLGTKGIYLFLGLLLLFHFLSHSSLKAKVFVILLGVALFFGITWYVQTESAQDLLSYFVIKTKENGLINMLLSGRNASIDNTIPTILDKWNFVNYFIGGQDINHFAIEMDFFDLFLFFGLVGGVSILILYFFTLFKLRMKKPFNFFFVFSYFLLAFFAGHFFYSATNALYLCLVSMYFYASQSKIELTNE